MLSAMTMLLATTYQREIAMGLFGLMGGVVRVLVAIAAKEPMPPSQIGATLICASIIPALGGDILREWLNLSNKAALLCSFIVGGAAIKQVLKAMQKAQDMDLSWPPSWKQGPKP